MRQGATPWLSVLFPALPGYGTGFNWCGSFKYWRLYPRRQNMTFIARGASGSSTGRWQKERKGRKAKKKRNL